MRGSTYTPKKGDRVRVTYVRDGEVIDADQERIWFQDDRYPMLPASAYPIGGPATIEKLQDPEPEWVNGDLIKCSTMTLARCRGVWRSVHADTIEPSQLITNYWNADKLEILYKTNAA